MMLMQKRSKLRFKEVKKYLQYLVKQKRPKTNIGMLLILEAPRILKILLLNVLIIKQNMFGAV